MYIPGINIKSIHIPCIYLVYKLMRWLFHIYTYSYLFLQKTNQEAGAELAAEGLAQVLPRQSRPPWCQWA